MTITQHAVGTARQPATPAHGPAHPRAILAIILVSYFMILLDNSIIFTALPTIGGAMHLSSIGLSWVQDAYTLVFGGLLLLGARLDSVVQALRSARPGGMVGWVGVPHATDLPLEAMFWRNVGLRGGPAPARAYLPELLKRVWDRQIQPGKVFDLTLPLEQVAVGYAAMDERRSIKTLLRPSP